MRRRAAKLALLCCVPACRFKNECEPRPLLLQDHSGFPNAPDTTMRFRNIWVRKLD
jgi:hypothetical protein